MYNGILQNPGWLNKTDYGDAAIFYRNQWAGVNGGPVTQAALFNLPVAKEKLMIGASFLNSNIGITQRFQGAANIAYRFHITKNTVMSLGLKAGITQFKLKQDDLILSDDISQDEAFLNAFQNTILPDFGFGAVIRSENALLGVSVMHLVPNSISFGSEIEQSKFADLSRHYYLMGSYNFDYGLLDFTPSALIKYVSQAPVQVDLNLNITYNDLVWGGVSYRTGDAIALMSGVYLYSKDDQKSRIFKIGYAYDLTQSALNQYSNGTHEIMVTVNFRVKSKIKCADEKPSFISPQD